MPLSRPLILIAVLLTSMIGICYAARDEQHTDIRVMTFNIRYGTAKDGENHWDLRKDFLIETIRAFGPDLLGTPSDHFPFKAILRR